jgi:hypothetical protein
MLAPPAWSQSASDAATIDELRQIIQKQQEQLDTLMQKVDALDQTTADITAQAPYAATAEAAHKEPKVIASGQDRVKLSVSGQVNRALLVTDDGDESDYFFVDNDNSSTRFRFIGTGQITDDFAIETALELQAESNSSADVWQENEQAGSSISMRRAEVLFKSKKFGTGYLGRGWTASDNTTEVDLSGTAIVAYSGIADMAAGLRFRRKSGLLTTFNVFDMFDNLDGLGRDDRFRYDTPNFAGFSGAFSATTKQNQWDAALNYASEIGSFDLAGALAYWKKGDNVKKDPATGLPTQLRIRDTARKDGWGGSFSVLHTSGFNATVAGGNANAERSGRDDQKYWYAKLGYRAQFWSIGDTNFSVDYWDGKNYVENSSKSKSWSITAVQQLQHYGTDLYASFRNYDPDLKTENLQDLKAFMLGARVKF